MNGQSGERLDQVGAPGMTILEGNVLGVEHSPDGSKHVTVDFAKGQQLTQLGRNVLAEALGVTITGNTDSQPAFTLEIPDELSYVYGLLERAVSEGHRVSQTHNVDTTKPLRTIAERYQLAREIRGLLNEGGINLEAFIRSLPNHKQRRNASILLGEPVSPDTLQQLFRLSSRQATGRAIDAVVSSARLKHGDIVDQSFTPPPPGEQYRRTGEANLRPSTRVARYIATKLGLTYPDIAGKMDWSHSKVTRLLSGQVYPLNSDFASLLGAFSREVEELSDTKRKALGLQPFTKAGIDELVDWFSTDRAEHSRRSTRMRGTSD